MVSVYYQASLVAVAKERSMWRGIILSHADLIWGSSPNTIKEVTLTSGTRVSLMALTLMASIFSRLSCG